MYKPNLHYEKFADGSVKCIEDEIPFELPDGWAWARLDSISEIITKGASPKWQGVDYTTSGTLFVTSENVGTGTLLLDSPKFLSNRINKIQPRSVLKKHDILTNIVGASIGRTCEYTLDDLANTNQAVAIIRLVDLGLVDFIIKCLSSAYCIDLMFENQVNVARANLSLSSLANFLIPIPPLSEKQRIMERVSLMFGHIDTISEDRTTLEALISKARSKILDLAIRGQLVPQDSADEPASVLLERIRAEKEELIRQGKIKRDKKESVIFRGEDNSYYCDIPDSWALCSLKELFNVCSAKRVRQSDWQTTGVPFYRAREIVKLSDNGYVDNDLFISEEHYMRVKKECGVPEPGDLMVSGVGTIGKVYVVKDDDRFYYKDASVLCFENRSGAIDSQFARYMLESEFMQIQMQDNSKGTTVDTITISAAMEYMCVLPPLEEQKRIVAAIEKAFTHLSSISTALA